MSPISSTVSGRYCFRSSPLFKNTKLIFLFYLNKEILCLKNVHVRLFTSMNQDG